MPWGLCLGDQQIGTPLRCATWGKVPLPTLAVPLAFAL